MTGMITSNLSNTKHFNRRFMKGKLSSAKHCNFLLKAWVCYFPTNANRFQTNKLFCKCNEAEKCNSHVLYRCPKMLPFINAKHNKILDILLKFLKVNLLSETSWEILREEIHPYFSSFLRSDIHIQKNLPIFMLLLKSNAPMILTCLWRVRTGGTLRSIRSSWMLLVLTFTLGHS